MSDVQSPVAPSALAATFANFQPPAKRNAIAKVNYSHDAMIDMIVANPWISQGELAAAFGYTEGWVSQVIASDAFQARLALRKDALVDPHLRTTIEERFKGLVVRSIELLMRRLDERNVPDEVLLKSLEVASKAAGYGAKNPNIGVQQNFVVQLPSKAPSVSDWAKTHGAGGPAGTLPPAPKTPQEVVEAVLVEPCPAAPTSKQLLDELRRS